MSTVGSGQVPVPAVILSLSYLASAGLEFQRLFLLQIPLQFDFFSESSHCPAKIITDIQSLIVDVVGILPLIVFL